MVLGCLFCQLRFEKFKELFVVDAWVVVVMH